MRGLYDVSGHNGRGDSGKLIAQIQNSSKSADTFARSNQRRDRPSHWRSGRQPADGHADPKQCAGGAAGMCGPKNSQAEGGSAEEHDLANANRIPAALNHRIDEPSAHSQVGERGESTWNAGVESGVQQINVERRGKIRRKPSQKKIESVIVRRETEAQTPDFTFLQQVSERGAFGGARDLRAALRRGR